MAKVAFSWFGTFFSKMSNLIAIITYFALLICLERRAIFANMLYTTTVVTSFWLNAKSSSVTYFFAIQAF
jgi:hypothetical protein